jgi:hypothetical protein
MAGFLSDCAEVCLELRTHRDASGGEPLRNMARWMRALELQLAIDFKQG